MPGIGRIIIYTKKTDQMVDFYQRLFGYRAVRHDGDRIVELLPQGAGAVLMLHPASKGQREGQSLVKLVFDVEDVEGFRDELLEQGLQVGPVHDGGGYVFANARDPSNNPISISSRAFAQLD